MLGVDLEAGEGAGKAIWRGKRGGEVGPGAVPGEGGGEVLEGSRDGVGVGNRDRRVGGAGGCGWREHFLVN